MVISRFKNFNIYFFLLVAFYFASITFLPSYTAVAKPLIMASLLGLYITVEKKQSPVFILGLIFAMLGDIFLQFNQETFFLIGLVCFFIMQCCYIFVFSNDYEKPTKKQLVYPGLLTILSLVILLYLWPYLGSLKLYVFLYFLSILSMVIFALLRRTSIPFYQQVVFGALLFMVSDTILAVHKFVIIIPLSNYWVMTTYIAAQYLIVTGIIDKNEQHQNHARLRREL